MVINWLISYFSRAESAIDRLSELFPMLWWVDCFDQRRTSGHTASSRGQQKGECTENDWLTLQTYKGHRHGTPASQRATLQLHWRPAQPRLFHCIAFSQYYSGQEIQENIQEKSTAADQKKDLEECYWVISWTKRKANLKRTAKVRLASMGSTTYVLKNSPPEEKDSRQICWSHPEHSWYRSAVNAIYVCWRASTSMFEFDRQHHVQKLSAILLAFILFLGIFPFEDVL